MQPRPIFGSFERSLSGQGRAEDRWGPPRQGQEERGTQIGERALGRRLGA